MPTLDPILIDSFDSNLHGVPQHGAKLKDTVRTRMGVVGTTHRFPALGKGRARQRGALQPIQPVTSEKAKPRATLNNAEDFEFLDIYQMAETNVSAMAGYAKNARMAVERQCDQRILNAMDSPNTDAIGTMIAANAGKPANNFVTLEKLVTMITALLRRGNTVGDRITFTYNQAHFEKIGQITQLLSRDYSERGFMATGNVPPVYGMQLRGIEDRVEEEGNITGLPVAKGFCYAMGGVGLALGNVQKMRVIDWRPDLQSWQIGAMILAGATVIDQNMLQEQTLAIA